jgi:hypothetical protein
VADKARTVAREASGPESFVPEVRYHLRNKEYGIMLVELRTCKYCGSKMVRPCYWGRGPFPVWHVAGFDAQALRAGWRHQAEDDICIACRDAGKKEFACAGCKEVKTSDKIKESYGFPAEHLCVDCYQTMPAAAWDEIEKRLEDEHRYDFD